MEFKLNNIKYLDKMLDQNWPIKEYALINSAWLAVSGIRENGDLDIIISSKLRAKYFNDMGLDKTIGIKGAFEKRVRIHPHNSAYGNFYNCNGIDDLIYNHTVTIDKIKFVELRFFLMYKKERLKKLELAKKNRSKLTKFFGPLLNQNRVLRKKINRDISDLNRFEKLFSSDNVYFRKFKKRSLDYPSMFWRLD